MTERTNALEQQVGGDHYKCFAIQPIELSNMIGLSFTGGSILKYALRHKNKGQVEDLKKAIHLCKFGYLLCYDILPCDQRMGAVETFIRVNALEAAESSIVRSIALNDVAEVARMLDSMAYANYEQRIDMA